MKVTNKLEIVKSFTDEQEYIIASGLMNKARQCNSYDELERFQEYVYEHYDCITIDITKGRHLKSEHGSEALVEIMHDIGKVFCIKSGIVTFNKEVK